MSPLANFDPLKIKLDFPIFNQPVHGNRELVYLDNGATTQKPIPVLSAMDECHRSAYANVHRGSHYLSLRASDAYDEARESVRGFINAHDANEIIFTSGSTMSINLVAHSLGDLLVRENDEILITEMEHHSNIVPWQQLAQRKNAHLRFLPIDDSGNLEMGLLDEYLTDRTSIFAFASISNVLGTVNPVKELTKRAHAVGAKVLVDAAQSVPHEVTDVRDTDVDFLVFSGHKMLGPSGVGVLYGKQESLDSMPPFLGGGNMINTVTNQGFTPGELPAKFESGTPPIVQAIGLAAAIDYLNATGLELIAEHGRKLATALMEKLSQIESVRVLGPPPDKRAALVSFVIDGVNSLDFATLIDLKGIAIRNGHHCTMPLHQRYGITESSRASFYLYNTLEEVHYFAEMTQKTIDLLRR